MRADLHIHTTGSDGRWSPPEVVAQVQQHGIDLFAITDHDDVSNVPAVAELAGSVGLAFLPGVEVSTRLDGRGVHVLGYGIDPRDARLGRLLEANAAELNGLNDEHIRALARAGYPIDLEEYAAYRHDPSRGGWRSLNYLIDKGLCRDVHDFFARLFVGSTVPPTANFAPLAEATEAIRAAGGVAILAHPVVPLRGKGVSEESMRPFLDGGIQGLECYSSYHDPAITSACLTYCAHHGLLVTGGSDCHGGFVGRPLGIPVVDVTDLRLGELASRLPR